jgi:hypothetical protein
MRSREKKTIQCAKQTNKQTKPYYVAHSSIKKQKQLNEQPLL